MIAKKSGFRYKQDKRDYQAKMETLRHRDIIRKKKRLNFDGGSKTSFLRSSR